jgi:tetratricopeptide (TPR) repeat protein
MKTSHLRRCAAILGLASVAPLDAQTPTSLPTTTRPATDAAAALRRGQSALREERFVDALAEFESAKAASPRDPEPLIFCGEALFLLDRFAEAVAAYAAAETLDRAAVAGVYNYGAALLKLRRPAEAKERFAAMAAAAKRPDAQARALFGVGASLADLGEDAAATAKFREALRVDPSLIRAKQRLGVLLLRAGDAAEATRLLGEVFAADPLYDGAAYNLALAYAALKDDAAAKRYREEFRRLRELKNRIDGYKLRLRSGPPDLETVLAVARAYREAPAPRDAARWFGRASGMPGFPPAAWLEFADALEAAGDARGAAAMRARAAQPR